MDANNTTSDNITIIDPFIFNAHIYTRHAAVTFISISFILGIPVNALVVLVHSQIKEKTVTDWMIFYIAICDILSLMNAPFYVCQFEGFWMLGVPNFFCIYNHVNISSSSMASYLYCAATAVERYFKVVRSKEAFSVRIARFLWLPVFVISFGLGSLNIWTVSNNVNGHCMYNVEGRYLATLEYIFLLSVAFGSSIIMTVCYTRTGIHLMIKLKEISQSYGAGSALKRSYKNTIQTTKMLAIVTVVFLFSANAPYVIGIMFTVAEPTKEPQMSIFVFFGISFFLNNFFNPFLYMAMSLIFRQRAMSLFRQCWKSRYAVTEESSELPNIKGAND